MDNVADLVGSLFDGADGLAGDPEVEIVTPADMRMLAAASEAQQEELERDAGEVDLDELLAESVAQAGTAGAARAARQRLRAERGKLSAAEVEALERDIERHELVQNWEVIGAAVAFTRAACQCGAQHTVFEGMMEKQRHRRDRSALRWHRVHEVAPYTSREVLYHDVEVPVCVACAFEKGWDLRVGETKAWEGWVRGRDMLAEEARGLKEELREARAAIGRIATVNEVLREQLEDAEKRARAGVWGETEGEEE